MLLNPRSKRLERGFLPCSTPDTSRGVHYPVVKRFCGSHHKPNLGQPLKRNEYVVVL